MTFASCRLRYALLFLVIGCEQSTGPAVQTDNECSIEHDFGILAKDTVVCGEVRWTNHGASAIEFQGSKTACGCLVILDMPRKVEAGGTGIIKFSLDTGGRSGAQEVGAWFFVSPGPMSNIYLKTTAIVESCWAFPKSIHFGVGSPREDRRKEFDIIAAGLPDAAIISVDSDLPWMTVEYEPNHSSEDSGGLRSIGKCRVRLNKEVVPVGQFSGNVRVAVHTDQKLQIDIPVHGEFANNVETTPGEMVFGVIGPTATVRECRIVFKGQSIEKVAEVVASHSWLDITVTHDPPKRSVLLSVSARQDGNVPSGVFSGLLVGRDSRGDEIFSIPYTGVTPK